MSIQINHKKINNPFGVLQNILASLMLLTKPGLRTFVWVPMLINFLLYIAAFWVSFQYVDELIHRFIPEWLSWLDWLLWPLFTICFFLVVFFTFTLLSNLIASPFYGILSERTERLLTGQELKPVASEPLMKSMISGPLAELKRLTYFLVRAIPLLILFLIPGVNLIAPFLWLVFSAWFLALEYFAYPLENRGLLFPAQRESLAKAKLGAITLGGVVMFSTSIPLLNLVAGPTAVIAATRLLVMNQNTRENA